MNSLDLLDYSAGDYRFGMRRSYGHSRHKHYELVAPYLGHYSNDVLGEITIEFEDGELIMDVGEFRSTVRSKAGEDGVHAIYIMSDAVLLGLPLQFVESETGNPIVVLGAGVIEYTFRKVE